MTRDTPIRGARVIDGTGAPWFRADVRVGAGRIAAVGPDIAAGSAQTVEAGGRFLAPRFIDAHCRDDADFLREPVLIPHGITNAWVAGEPGVAGGAVTGLPPGRVLGGSPI